MMKQLPTSEIHRHRNRSKKAAKKLNVDCDSAAAIEEADETGVASKAMGYGALYLVSSFPVIIGISVVFILFYNSLQ
ncbi:unnamed protein product [Brassica oleracea var. botrytis]